MAMTPELLSPIGYGFGGAPSASRSAMAKETPTPPATRSAQTLASFASATCPADPAGGVPATIVATTSVTLS